MPLRTIVELTEDADLSPTQQMQIVEAGRRYDGEDRNIGERTDWGSEEACLLDQCEVLSFQGADGTPYDVVWIEGGCGTVFRAGSLDVVAEFMEMHVTSQDQALAAALGRALRAGSST